MKKEIVGAALIGSLLLSANSFALGYVSRDCPQAGAKESFTMSWLKPEWLYTISVLYKKIGKPPHNAVSQVFRSGNTWAQTRRSAAGIHPWSNGTMSDYFAGVYGIHYYYNEATKQIESRRKYVSQSCDILNWGVNNW
jgi:hypothetical protein